MVRLAKLQAPGAWPEIEASLGADTRRALDAAISAAWVPVELDVAVMEAVTSRLGWDAARKLVEARQREEMGSALFSTFVTSILRLAGTSPGQLVKQVPTGWKQLFRDCGTFEILELGAREARLSITGLPACCTTSAPWMGGIPAGLALLYGMIKREGRVEYEGSFSARKAMLRFSWT
jgi:hypothetical protein